MAVPLVYTHMMHLGQVLINFPVLINHLYLIDIVVITDK